MHEPLLVGYSARTQVAPLVGLGAFFLAGLLAWVLHVVPGWIAGADTLLFGGILVYGLVTLRRMRPDVPVVRLDQEGLTVASTPTVPWSDLREVVVGPMRPAWLVGSGRVWVVSFVPREGVELPGPPQPGGRPQGWGRRFRERFYGTNLLLLSSAMTVESSEIAQAAHELGDLPVRHVPFRRNRRWLVIIVGGLLLGLAIGFVSRLVA